MRKERCYIMCVLSKKRYVIARDEVQRPAGDRNILDRTRSQQQLASSRGFSARIISASFAMRVGRLLPAASTRGESLPTASDRESRNCEALATQIRHSARGHLASRCYVSELSGTEVVDEKHARNGTLKKIHV